MIAIRKIQFKIEDIKEYTFTLKDTVQYFGVSLYFVTCKFYGAEAFSICGQKIAEFVKQGKFIFKEEIDFNYEFLDVFVSKDNGDYYSTVHTLCDLLFRLMSDSPTLSAYITKFKPIPNAKLKRAYNTFINQLVQDDQQIDAVAKANLVKKIKVFKKLCLHYESLSKERYEDIVNKIYKIVLINLKKENIS